MTAFTKSTPGAPEGGFYSVGDTVTDSNSIVWTCTVGGFAVSASAFGYGRPAQFVAQPTAQVTATNVGTLQSVTGLSVVESGTPEGVHKTVLTMAAMSTTIVDANQAGSQKLYTFPEGRILVLGVTAKALTPTTTSAIASTLNSGVTGSLALGTAAAAADGTLTSTEADILPSTSWTSSTTINVAAAAVNAALASSAQFDGTSAAKAVYFNLAIPTATDIDADATVTWSGIITLKWVFLGDY